MSCDLAYGRALFREYEQSRLVEAGIFEPGQVIDNDNVRKCLDFSEPIALLRKGTLRHYDGTRPGRHYGRVH